MKFSENSIQTLYKAAEIRKDERIISAINESRETFADLIKVWLSQKMLPKIHAQEGIIKVKRRN
jgi:hypothetical protein